MKELNRLQAHIRWCEYVQLALLTLCQALPIAMLFTEDDPYYRLFWALGTVIPVQLIRFFCERMEKKPMRWLLSLAVLALTMAATRSNYHWVYYLACCLWILLSGLLLPRPRGKLIFTVPHFYTLVFAAPAFALGKAVGAEMLSQLAIAVTALLTLNYLLYANQTRLLRDILMSKDTEVSVKSVIPQNQRLITGYLLAAILIVGMIPFILQRENRVQPERPIFESVAQTIATEAETEPPEKDYRKTEDAEPLNLELFKNIWVWIVVALPISGVLIGVGYGILVLIRFLRDLKRRKHSPTTESEGMTIERLESEGPHRAGEHITGYEKKIRRRYEKLIKSRAASDAHLAALTPTELEACAEVTGPGADVIHEIYRRTRYSEEPAARETYAAFKEAIRTLDPPRKTRDQDEPPA